MVPCSGPCTQHEVSSNLSAATIADLPDEVLQQVLGLCSDLRERQRAALVCKHFAALACSPALLQHLQLPRVAGLPALQSLAAWLSRHGRHARTLEFDGWAGGGAAADSAVATCLAAVGAAGRLTKLQAVSSCATDWLAAMRSVRHLKLLSYTAVHVSATIAGISTLQSLTLGGNSICIPDGVRLPTSITRLFVEDGSSQRMPPQLAQLLRLQRLKLCECGYSADSLAQLSALSGSLTRLEVSGTWLPAASLAALTGLQQLHFDICWGATALATSAALPHLTALTCLVLWSGLGWDALLPALSGLPRLQLCEMRILGGEAPTAQLPSGPWLHSLRWLSVRTDSLLNSTAVLPAAAALECMSALPATGRPEVDWDSPAAAAFFDWLARHPPLRRASFEDPFGEHTFEAPSFGARLATLHSCRPALLVQVPHSPREDASLLDYLYRTQPFEND